MDEELEAPYPQYRCPVCKKDLPLDEARVTITCAEHLEGRHDVAMEVRAAKPGDKKKIEAICDQAWGEVEIDVFGRTFDVMKGLNLVAMIDGSLAGLMSLALHRGEAAIVLHSVYPEHQGAGIGSALLVAAEQAARERRLPSLVAAVSNDDIPGLYFYQRHGFVIFEIAVGALADAFGSAAGGFSGIPVRDEIRLRRSVV